MSKNSGGFMGTFFHASTPDSVYIGTGNID